MHCIIALNIDITYSISTMDTLRNGIYCGQQTITIVRCPRALNELNWLGIVNLFSRRLLWLSQHNLRQWITIVGIKVVHCGTRGPVTWVSVDSSADEAIEIRERST